MSSPDGRRPRQAVLIGCLATGAVNFSPLLIGASAPIIRTDIGLNTAGVGLAFALFLLGAMVCSFVLSRFASPGEPGVIARYSVAVAAVAAFGIGATASTPTILLVWMVPMGVALGLAEWSITSMMPMHVSRESIGKALAIKQAALPAASLGAGLLVALAVTTQWRIVHLVLAAILVAIIPFIPVTRRTQRASALPVARMTRSALLMTGALAFGFAATNSLAMFFIDSSIDLGTAPGYAGALLAMASVVAGTTRIVTGFLVDRRPHSHVYPLVLFLIACGLMGNLLLVTMSSGILWLAVLLGLGLGYGWTGLAFVALVRSPGVSGKGLPLGVFVGMFGGGLVGPLIVGFVSEGQTYQFGWILTSGFAGAAVLFAAAALVESRRHSL